MTLLPILARFTTSILLPTGLCTPHCRAFLAFCDMADFITSVNRGKVTHEQITESVHIFLGLFVAVWGVSKLTPKFHWLLHFSLAFRRFGILLACFVAERFHKFPKQYAGDLKNTSSQPGASLIKEVVCHCLAMIQAPDALNFKIGLVKPKKPSRSQMELIEGAFAMDMNAVSVHVSILSRFNKFECCSTDDSVYVKESTGDFAAQVIQNMDIDGDSLTLINKWTLRVKHADGYAEYEDRHNPILIFTNEILDTLPFTRLNGGICGVLLPCEFR